MFRNLKLRSKILLAILVPTMISIFIIGWQGYSSAKRSLKEESFKKLTAIREIKKRQIETYFNQIRSQILTFSEDRMIIDAMSEFKAAFHSTEKDPGTNVDAEVRDYYEKEYLTRLNPKVDRKRLVNEYWPEDVETIVLQYLYIASNPYPTGEKDKLIDAGDSSPYSRAHAKMYVFKRLDT